MKIYIINKINSDPQDTFPYGFESTPFVSLERADVIKEAYADYCDEWCYAQDNNWLDDRSDEYLDEDEFEVMLEAGEVPYIQMTISHINYEYFEMEV